MAFLVTIRKDSYGWTIIGGNHKKRSCETKVRYGRKETASRAGLAMERKTSDKFDVYECQYCKGWHIGHSYFAD